MSEQTAPKSAETPAARPSSPPKAQETKAQEKKPADDVPAGCAAVFVAIPGRVADENGAKASAGKRIICGEKNADALEMRGLAFRDENEAKAAFTTYKRRKEAEIAERAEAMRQREERRQRWKDELAKASDGLEWQA